MVNEVYVVQYQITDTNEYGHIQDYGIKIVEIFVTHEEAVKYLRVKKPNPSFAYSIKKYNINNGYANIK